METLREELEVTLRDLQVILKRLREVERREVERRKVEGIEKQHSTNIATLMKRSPDVLVREVGDIFPQNEILDRLSFEEINGDACSYMTEKGMRSQSLKSLRTKFDHNLYGDGGLQIKLALQDLVRQFLHLFFYGDPGKGIDGLHQGIRKEFALHAGVGAGTCLSWNTLSKLLLSLHEPELIVSTPQIAARTKDWLLSVGYIGATKWPMVPYRVATVEGIPWMVTDGLVGTETARRGAFEEPTGGACSSIFVLNFEALSGVTRSGIRVVQNGWKDDGYLQWDVAVLHRDLRCLGKIDGIWDGGVQLDRLDTELGVN